MLNPAQFQAKEEKVKAANDSLSEADLLSEMHPLNEASNSLSGWETLEEDKSEISTPNEQPACLVWMLSLLALRAPPLAKQKFTNYRLASLQKLKSPRAFKNTEVVGVKKRTG
ncbi:hypothetical protein GYH30_055313 [Glycine max]|nr:hypothetical protein GYH30_055313 [Glycine max]